MIGDKEYETFKAALMNELISPASFSAHVSGSGSHRSVSRKRKNASMSEDKLSCSDDSDSDVQLDNKEG